MTSYPNSVQRTLSDSHRHMLEVGSAISRKVYEESGVQSIADGRQLPPGFSSRQRKRGGGMLFIGHRPNGKTFYIFRPDGSDPDNPGLKYEATCKKLGGPGNVLYVHPSQRQLIDDTGVPVIFVEGIKKALSIITAASRVRAAVLVVAISGVWNWLSGGKPIADMLDIPIEGREVHVCFDSDIFSNPDVGDAARRLADHLIGRGAVVYLCYLPVSSNGPKTGADDFLARGHTYRELMALMRLYDARDLRTERLERDEELHLKLDYLRRAFWDAGFTGMGGCSARDVFKVLIDAALDRSKLHADGLRIKISRSELAKMAKVSTRTLQKAIELLEKMGLIYRDNEGRRRRERGAFVLRASVNHYRKSPANTRRATDVETASTLSSLHLRSPRLMWSSPAFKGLRGTVAGTRKVRQGPPPVPRSAITRLGKTRGAALDVLDAAGGVSTVDEIYDALHPGKAPDKRRPRDLVRRKKTEKGRDGLLVMLEDSGILAIEGDVVTLTDNWLEALDEQRKLGKEIDSTDVGGHVVVGAETVARRRLEAKGRAFQQWSNGTLQISGHWTNNPDADGHVEDLHHITSILSEGDRQALEAIEAFEQKYGRGSFRWDRASCKELFYSSPEGIWPQPEELQRIRDYLVANGGVAA